VLHLLSCLYVDSQVFLAFALPVLFPISLQGETGERLGGGWDQPAGISPLQFPLGLL